MCLPGSGTCIIPGRGDGQHARACLRGADRGLQAGHAKRGGQPREKGPDGGDSGMLPSQREMAGGQSITSRTRYGAVRHGEHRVGDGRWDGHCRKGCGGGCCRAVDACRPPGYPGGGALKVWQDIGQPTLPHCMGYVSKRKNVHNNAPPPLRKASGRAPCADGQARQGRAGRAARKHGTPSPPHGPSRSWVWKPSSGFLTALLPNVPHPPRTSRKRAGGRANRNEAERRTTVPRGGGVSGWQ